MTIGIGIPPSKTSVSSRDVPLPAGSASDALGERLRRPRSAVCVMGRLPG